MRPSPENIVPTPLLEGIGREAQAELFTCLGARTVSYAKGETVLREGETTVRIGLVLSGRARTLKHEPDGGSTMISLLRQGSVIGVLLAASPGRKSPVTVEALTALSVLFLPYDRVAARCGKACEAHDRLIRNLLAVIAEKALLLHDRNDCLIRPSVRSKVLAYLGRFQQHCPGESFTIPLNRAMLAAYLHVDRSALSRELARMKRDGILEVEQNTFRLR